MELLFFAIILAIPFYFIWNALAPVYFYWLPEVYKEIPFWHCVGILVLIAIVRLVLFPSASVVNKYISYKKSRGS